MFSFSYGVAVVISLFCILLIFPRNLLPQSTIITIIITLIAYRCKKKKKYKTKILILTSKLISDIFLLFLVTIAKVNIKAKDLEVVILCFQKHHEAFSPPFIIHSTQFTLLTYMMLISILSLKMLQKMY